MDRTKLFDLKRSDLPDLLEKTTEVAPMDPRRKIFVNRNLRLDKIEMIGFDMDYTLAIYKKLRIEELAFNLTVEKLIAKKGYPDAIRQVRYDPERVIRGLVVDKKRGNIFKMDRFAHIGKVRHGGRELPREEKIKLYRTRKLELDAFNHAWIDTLFALPEACLYSQLVDFFDEHGGPLPEGNGGGNGGPNGAAAHGTNPVAGGRSYRQLYADIRAMIDEAHADNSIKSVIRANPEEYIHKEPELAFALHRFRSSGKRLFLLTNSLFDYTDAVMRFLLDGQLAGYPSWKNYFDHIIVGARKPAFFVKRNPFRRVDEATGAPEAEDAQALERGKVYEGGNLRDFERLAHFAGERVLYIGDHIYGDILRSKKSSLWRTAMIVPELEDVLWHQQVYASDISRVAELEDEMRRLEFEVNYYKLLLSSVSRLKESGDSEGLSPAEESAIRDASLHAREALEAVKARVRALAAEHRETQLRLERAANPNWGLLFSEGSEMSLFGKQVEDYACVYTSRVSNFLYYSPVQYFRSPRYLMPHERP